MPKKYVARTGSLAVLAVSIFFMMKALNVEDVGVGLKIDVV